MKQQFSSAQTSINALPAVFRLLDKYPGNWSGVSDVLDYGGGRYDQLTDKLSELRIRNWIYDPFNRSEEHNAFVRRMLTIRPADLAICSNVLCVISEPDVRQEIMQDIQRLTACGGNIYFKFHEGDKTGKGKETPRGWQANRTTKSWLKEIQTVFPYADIPEGYSGKLIRTMNLVY